MTFNRRLQGDLAVFYYQYSNFQTSVAEITEAGIFQVVTRDAGNATAYGFEQSLRFLAAQGLTLFGSYDMTLSLPETLFDKHPSMLSMTTGLPLRPITRPLWGRYAFTVVSAGGVMLSCS